MHRGNAARFLVAFGVIVVLKWGTILQPPVWDTAMGLFPAALTLVWNGFDLVELHGMPGYLDGGPNHHGTSLVTLLTAVVLAASGGGATALVILHLLQYAAAALALVVLYDFARPLFGDVGTALLCLAVLLHPVFSVQVGFLYMEVAIFLFAVLALRAWSQQRFWPAVLWATLAYAIKEPGLLVPGTLAVASLLERRTLIEKAQRLAAIMAPSVVWTAAVFGLRRAAAVAADDFSLIPSLDPFVWGVGQYLRRFLLNVPDLLLFILTFLTLAAVYGGPVLGALRREPQVPATRSAEHQEQLVLGYTGVLILLFGLMFTVVLPATIGYTLILPRYYVTVLPFLLLWLGYGAKRLLASRVRQPAALLFGVLAVGFLVNTNGVLYPLDINTEGIGNDPPLTERSNAYRRLLALEMDAMRALEELPDGVPVYYGHYEHYLFQYPELGFSNGPLSDGHNIFLEPLAEPFQPDAMPPCLYVLYNYPWLGGEKILGLIQVVESRPDFAFEVVRELRDGRYVITLARVRRVAADCPV